MSWWNCIDSTCHFPRQIINVNYINQLVTYLESREEPFEVDFERSGYDEKVAFELGGFGAYIGTQPRMTIDIFDSQLTVDCADVPEWIRILKENLRRKFEDGTEYIIIPARMRCLILTLPERESLLFQLSGRLQEAREESQRFHDGLQAAYDLMETGPFTSMFPTIDIKNLSNLFNKKGDDEPKE